jgi:hypothetical protein
MQHAVLIRLDWDHTAIPLKIRGFYTCRVDPEPGHPFGRKGLQIASAWATLATPGCAGLVILDGDVAIDPRDQAAMLAAVELEPAAVHVAPVRLWPASTKKDAWVWGHGRGAFTRDDPDDPDVFGLSFTYLPQQLVEASVRAGLAGWAYPDVDRKIRQASKRLGMTVRVVRAASPTHLNY